MRQRPPARADPSRLGTRAEELGPRHHEPELIELPFGLGGEPPPPASRRPLRERFPQIRETTPSSSGGASCGVGSTPRRRFARSRDWRTPGRTSSSCSPRRAALGAATEATNATERARQLACDLGVLDRTVLFWEDWVPFDQRHELLAEADIGLSLHGVTSGGALLCTGPLPRLPVGLAAMHSRGRGRDRNAVREAGFSALVTPGDDAMVRDALDPSRRRSRCACPRSRGRLSHWRGNTAGRVLPSHWPKRSRVARARVGAAERQVSVPVERMAARLAVLLPQTRGQGSVCARARVRRCG